ncbi:hypothetical protein GCM10022222_18100 [Amycolatopsis ultiminotia]|uniref:Uncharacterized protein n=1 Tax=Amycolatopsis ultiminotia TaxID=543629 RepID=A0ABP6VKU7_9PSEU
MDSVGDNLWIRCGCNVDENLFGLLIDPLALWANYPHPGEISLCINEFRRVSFGRVRACTQLRAHSGREGVARKEKRLRSESSCDSDASAFATVTRGFCDGDAWVLRR